LSHHKYSANYTHSETAPARTETLSWRRQDAFFILVTSALCAAAFYQPVLRAGGGLVILFLALFSMLNPFSAAIYLAASQTLVNAPGLTYTPAQLSAAGFALALLFRGRLSDLPGTVLQCLKWMVPFLLIFAAKRIFIWNSVPTNQNEMLALSACVMMAVYYREGAKNKWLWFFCLCIGAVIGISALVLHLGGLEAAVQTDMGGTRERLYVGRAANATSIGLVAGLGGMLALWLAIRLRILQIVPQRWQRWISLGLLVMCWLSLLTVFATGSRAGAIGALIVIAGALAGAFLLPLPADMQISRGRIVPALLIIAVTGIVMVALPQTGFIASAQRMLEFSKVQAEESRTDLLVAGRYETWYPALLDFLDAPILGTLPGQWQRTTFGAHNVFIGIAKGFGLVGLIPYLVYFIGPTWQVSRRLSLRVTLPFVTFLLGIFLIFSSLDFANYKTFHVYNGIMIGLILAQNADNKQNETGWHYRSKWKAKPWRMSPEQLKRNRWAK